MTEAISASNVKNPVTYVVTDENGTVLTVNKKLKPDTFEKKSNVTPMGMVVAGTAAIGAGKGAFEGLKVLVDKTFNWIGTQAKQYEESGNAIKGLSSKAKANIKFGIAGAGAILAAALVFQDKDKDGKLDIMEAVEKFVKPSK